MITYEVNQADLNRVMRALEGMESKAPRVIKNAVNHTAKKARKELLAGIQKGYTVKSAGFNSRMKIKNATNTRLYATITAKGRTMTIGRFKTSAAKSSTKADITKTGLKNLQSTRTHWFAFKIRSGKSAGLIAQRKYRNDKEANSEENMARRKAQGKKIKCEHGYPIRILRSNSLPKMMEQVYKGQRGVKKALDPMIQRTLHDEISKEIAKIKG